MLLLIYETSSTSVFEFTLIASWLHNFAEDSYFTLYFIANGSIRWLQTWQKQIKPRSSYSCRFECLITTAHALKQLYCECRRRPFLLKHVRLTFKLFLAVDRRSANNRSENCSQQIPKVSVVKRIYLQPNSLSGYRCSRATSMRFAPLLQLHQQSPWTNFPTLLPHFLVS